MDQIIKHYKGTLNAELGLYMSDERGVAWQKSMEKRVPYDLSYFNKCASYDGSNIANAINKGRIDLVDKYVGKKATVLDVGIGSGEFIRSRPGPTFGTDINPIAIKWLKNRDKYSDTWEKFSAFTFWDVIEHVESPQNYFRAIPKDAYLFTSLPIFDKLEDIKNSKHYRPNEHLYYWTNDGFINWMKEYRFDCLETTYYEQMAGRSKINSYAFKKSLPDYHDTLLQYAEMHGKAYGTTGMLYFPSISKEVLSLNPRSILDWGCGRSDIASYFWNDGKRKIEKYDPAISEYKSMPNGKFDLILCTDVMEHIPMLDIDNMFHEMREKSKSILFTISMKPARAKLPDGRNAHITLLNEDEWLGWIRSVFKIAKRIPLEWDHILMVRTY